MKNPWFKFKSTKPYILSQDLLPVSQFNKRYKNTPFSIQTQLLPEPYIGNPETAQIILLSLNPGYNEQDNYFHKNNQNFRKIILKNLNHTSNEYPFFPFNPLIKNSPVARYWRMKLSDLIKESSEENISKRICCIEYFPYHSKKYHHLRIAPISQNYSKKLIKGCIDNKALLIIMRAKKKWYKLIEELKTYDNCFSVHSFANPSITKNNLGEKAFEEVLKRLKQ